jgi:hypothetical protein
MTAHTIELLMDVLDCRRSEIEHWTKLLGSKIPDEGLTDHQAAAIGAIVWCRKNTPQTKAKLERFFARLAFMTDPESEWTVHRIPRQKEPQIVVDPLVDLSFRHEYAPGVLFDKSAFIAELSRRVE